MKIKVKEEGRKNIYIPDKESLKLYIKSKNFKTIHNFKPCGNLMLGADHSIESVISSIDNADRMAIFTDKTQNNGHMLAIIKKEQLSCFDIGEITKKDLIITI